jgi:hypothetical protein
VTEQMPVVSAPGSWEPVERDIRVSLSGFGFDTPPS